MGDRGHNSLILYDGSYTVMYILSQLPMYIAYLHNIVIPKRKDKPRVKQTISI